MILASDNANRDFEICLYIYIYIMYIYIYMCFYMFICVFPVFFFELQVLLQFPEFSQLQVDELGTAAADGSVAEVGGSLFFPNDYGPI